jgi:hypothetical protein
MPGDTSHMQPGSEVDSRRCSRYAAPMDDALLDRIVERISQVEGIRAIVLGGSRASGTHTPQSDFDIGPLYRGKDGFDLAALGLTCGRLGLAPREHLRAVRVA